MTQDELKLVFNALKQCNIFAYAGGLGVRATAHTDALAILEKALAQEQEPWCMKMNGCKTKCEDCPVEVAQPEQDNTYVYASSLATTIWQKHYIKESPKFALLDTTEGVLTQIDNMTCGLVREKLAQPEQEPVAWMVKGDLYKTQQFHLEGGAYANQIPLYTTPPQRTEQEPVADDFFRMIADRNPKPFPLPQRRWVGLTDEEIEVLFQTAAGADEEVHIRFARAIESKLKEVNT